jgi:ABC-type branched-subunit amino acid transport system ATPase component
MRLSTESVTKSFAGVHALNDVSVEVGKGQVIGVIGPNGSGKTTLVNVISGVIPPTSGTVCIGEDRWSRRSSFDVARCGVARTFQTIRLFEEMTVLENVEVAAASSPRTRGLRRARAASREALAMLGLEDRSEAMAANLSYGMQRRVELARAVAGKPDFLLLDEPAAGLNESESDELLETLLRLRDTIECGVLMIDHDLRLIMRGTERIFVLNEGKLLADGTPEQVRNDPRVVASYLGTDVQSAAAEMAADPHVGDPSRAQSGSKGGEE